MKRDDARLFEELRQRVEKNRASKKPIDLIERGEYEWQKENADYDAAVAAFSEVISVAPKTQEAEGALYSRAMVYVRKRDYDKVIADCTELMRSGSYSGPRNASPVPLWRALAYANKEETWDKALTDLSTFIEYGDAADRMCMEEYYPRYWANLLRAAIRVRRATPPTDVQAAKEFLAALEDAEEAVVVHPGHEAYVLAAYIFEKGRFTEATRLPGRDSRGGTARFETNAAL